MWYEIPTVLVFTLIGLLIGIALGVMGVDLTKHFKKKKREKPTVIQRIYVSKKEAMKYWPEFYEGKPEKDK